MITFTCDEATTLLDILIASADAQQWELDTHISTHGEWYRPERVAFMKKYIQKTDQQITALRRKLNTEPWVKTYSGGEPQYTKPLEPIRPAGSGGTGEPTVDGWPLWSGLPQQKKPVVDKSMAKRIATQLGWEPKREWIGLSDAEIGEIYRAGWSNNMDFARALEAKIKEKNT
jgi:hypothetical protein